MDQTFLLIFFFSVDDVVVVQEGLSSSWAADEYVSDLSDHVSCASINTTQKE